ncbi:MAG: Gfo/Idh/MocA family oxidoreductase [Phycisphaeraceae bacterium]|nr:Gfo/Idh/MocA family oxidoreductase [Phycisphaeraceae bacterium]
MTSATPELGIGIVGFGWMGKTHAYAYRSLPYMYRSLPRKPRLVGVAVRREETLDQAVELGGFAYGTTDYAKLLSDPAIHAIHICTPNKLHADQAIAALRAGKHVYCDKPLTTSAGEARRIMDAERETGGKVVTMVATQYRHYPCTLRAKQLIDEGRLGKLLSFRCCYLHATLVDAERPAGWRQLEGEAGGPINDLGSHVLDLLTHMVGPMAQVCAASQIVTPKRQDKATGHVVDIAAEDTAVMLLRSQGGALGTAEVTKLATGVYDELRMELHGDKGAIRFNLADPNWVEYYDQTQPENPIGGLRGFQRIQTLSNYPPPFGNMLPGRSCAGWLSAHIACVHHFVRSVAGETKANPSFAEAAELHRLLDAATCSAEHQQWINLAKATPS